MDRLFIALLAIILSAHFNSNAQNCTATSVGYPPLNDLGTGYWHGKQGGLYPNGSNLRPVIHNNAGLGIAAQVVPLDTAGNPDPVNGKIVWLSIGMSNTTQETQAFLPLANGLSNKNPKLVLVDGAQGGQDIVILDNPNSAYWTGILTKLAQSNVTRKQVQAVWFKEAEMGPTDTAFASYPDSLKIKFLTAIRIAKNKFPNTKLCYVSSRIYAGYATSALNPEPYAYYSGWSVKRLIEDQVNGDTSLRYSGTNPPAPWLSWGPYLWADGTTPRQDGLTWVCPADYNSDGTHPSTAGRLKVANMLLQFFSTDVTAIPWFLNSVSGITNPEGQQGISLIPNPFKDRLSIHLSAGAGKFSDVNIYAADGRHVFHSYSTGLDLSVLPAGLYYAVLVTEDGTKYCRKVVKE